MYLTGKDTKKRGQNKINSFIFYAEFKYLRYSIAKIQKNESRTKKIITVR